MLILYKGFIIPVLKEKKHGIEHFSKIKIQGAQLSKCQKEGYFQSVSPFQLIGFFFYSAGTGENPAHECNTVRRIFPH